ncbi:putative T7SS-secreted protein [Microbacterium sp. NPDC058269]|uniref:putative T7SS-secreted protein n=1 Tax=Microbacterium sp. NPDC058269 TaxID=3346414 RepID=UPI0036DC5FF4
MELGQTQSPTDLIPGSVSDVRATAEAWKARSAAATQVHDDLARLDDDGTWKGDAYDAYLERFDRQLLHWKDAGEGLRAGANALFTWADALEWAQEEADRAITLWNEAEQQAAAALATHRASMRELRVGQGLRHPEVDVPFVDPSGAAHDEAREVLFNARMTLEVFARDCATRLDEAAAAARMPLTDAEAGDEARRAITTVAFDVAVVRPFRATLDMLAVSAQTLWEHPDIILELLGGVALVIGGGVMMGGGGAVAVTGVGAVPGGGLAWAGAGVAAAGLAAAGHAAGRWANESASNATEGPPPHPIHGGRNALGQYNGDGQRPWVDTEKIGLDQVEERLGVDVIRDKVRAIIEGFRQPGASTDQHRYFDGLYRNADGTYTAIEVKSGGGTQNAAQRGFDSTLSVERPATAMLNGEKIQIVRVILKEVP